MEIKIRENIENTIKKHRLLNDKLHQETTQAVTDPTIGANYLKRYSPEVAAQKLQEDINGMVTSAKALDKLYNAEVKAQFERARAAITPAEVHNFERPADYQQQISNALTFISLQGERMTDTTAYAILKPFFNDWDQMRLFEQAILQQTHMADEYAVRAAFPKALGDVLNMADENIMVFAEAEMLAENLFIREKCSDATCNLSGYPVFGGYGEDSYDERSAQDRLLELAELIEDIGNNHDFVRHNAAYNPEQARRARYFFNSNEPDESFIWL